MINPMYGSAMYAVWLEGQLRSMMEAGKDVFYHRDFKKIRRRAWKRRRNSGLYR